MTVARKQQICLEQTPYYHIYSRCVRRAFLCGKDALTGQCFEHRRDWLLERIKLVSSVFAIDVCSYAIMSNHFHLVLRVGDTADWPANRVLMAWASLYALPSLCERYLRGDIDTQAELRRVYVWVDEYRERLMSISWLMKSINEYIARRANEEDECSGHFWESRFKCQALLDERALLSCMAYVDLNPIRAGMAVRLIDSEFTAIEHRINQQETWLAAFGRADLPYYLSSYIELLEASIDVDNKGFSNNAILSTMGIDEDIWLSELKGFEGRQFTAVGTVHQLQQYAAMTNRKRTIGTRLARALE